MGRILVRGEQGHDIIHELYPIAGEPVIDKPGKGSFYATDLEDILQNRGIKTLFVCGVTLEVCVHTTVREANDRGYECVVLTDCVASYFPEFQRIGAGDDQGTGRHIRMGFGFRELRRGASCSPGRIPMATNSRLYPNLYKDSVSLMTVTVQVTDVPGIDAGSVVMASATNVENLAQAGLGDFEVQPNDLVVAVSGTEEACAEALATRRRPAVGEAGRRRR